MKIHGILFLILLLVAATGSNAGEDWAAILGEGGDSAGESAVLGMTVDELQAYLEEVTDEADEEVPEDFVRNRRRFVMREMKFNTDWDCDPTAVPAMVEQLKTRTGMAAAALVPRTPLRFDLPELFDWPFVYLTAHYAFEFSDDELAGLRRYIERGGFVLADDCLYGQTFGPAFEGEIARLFPGSSLTAIDGKHPVYGNVYRQKYTFPAVHESGVPQMFMNANPYLGLIVGGRLGVVYTPQDFGCNWEISSPPTPSNPMGAGMHGMDFNGTRDPAYRIGINIIFYSLLH